MREFNVGIIGLGSRGTDLTKHIVMPRDYVKVTAICDEYQDRVDAMANHIVAEGGQKPYTTTNWEELIDRGQIDVLFVFTAWENHIPAAIRSMKAGIPVAVEVGGAYSVNQLWHLVQVYEETLTPIMLLENCCYGRTEMMLLNMIDQGVFGDIIHAEGGYLHDLRDEISYGIENRHYRLRNYLKRNSENYPTHELGPIAQMLGINRGNRMLSLISNASGAIGLNSYIKEKKSDDDTLLHARFNQGDVVTTLVTCANGETITLKLDTTLPRYYSRGLLVQGTKGMYNEENDSIFLEGVNDQDHFYWNKHWGNAVEYREKYESETWQRFLNDGVRGGHGGMDWLVFDAFFEALDSNSPMPIDVYDMASWMSITPLSEESLATGQRVAIPDFTNGMWLRRK